MINRPLHLEREEAALLQATLRPHARRLNEYVDRLIPTDVSRLIDPQDVTQDTFFDAARLIGQMPKDDPDSVWRWLATIARHNLTDLIRRHRAAKRGGGRIAELDEVAARHGSVIVLLEELAAHSRTPSRSAIRRELLATLEQSMAQIDLNYREAIRLRYIEGLSLAEAAIRMSRTEDSTKKLCLRGLRALREHMRSASLFV